MSEMKILISLVARFVSARGPNRMANKPVITQGEKIY